MKSKLLALAVLSAFVGTSGALARQGISFMRNQQTNAHQVTAGTDANASAAEIARQFRQTFIAYTEIACNETRPIERAQKLDRVHVDLIREARALDGDRSIVQEVGEKLESVPYVHERNWPKYRYADFSVLTDTHGAVDELDFVVDTSKNDDRQCENNEFRMVFDDKMHTRFNEDGTDQEWTLTSKGAEPVSTQ